MKPNTPAPADPALMILLACGLAAEAIAALLIHAAALLLTLAGWRPCSPPPPPALLSAAPLPLAPPPLERLRVVELRALARAAGLPQLARSGRRAQLLEALAAAAA